MITCRPLVRPVRLARLVPSLSFLAAVAFAAPAVAQSEAPPPVIPAEPVPSNTPTSPASSGSGLGGGTFGERGQLVLSADLPGLNSAPTLFLVHSSVSMGGTSSTSMGLAPSLDYFVAPNVSLGGTVGFANASRGSGATSTDLTVITVGARVGFNLALTNMLSLWPRLGLSYNHFSSSSGGSSTSTTAYDVALIIQAPLLWHPTSHFFIGAGPMLMTEVAISDGFAKTTDVGVDALIGGYFSL